mmetsp:Transcript_31633/g.43166  ORF Transcript_31633/g.43166 Transcript_31633/m.43166 type:complete len:288 (-) Transcript_31633:1085-1948(-)
MRGVIINADPVQTRRGCSSFAIDVPHVIKGALLSLQADVHNRHELLDEVLDGGGEPHGLLVAEDVLVASAERRVREYIHQQRKLAALRQQRPLEEVSVHPEVVLPVRAIFAGHVWSTYADAVCGHLQGGGVVGRIQNAQRIHLGLNLEQQLLICQNGHVRIHCEVDELEPLEHVLLALRTERPFPLSSYNIKAIGGDVHRVGFVAARSNEGGLRQVHDVAVVLLSGVHGALGEVTVVNKKVALRGLIQHEVALDPRLGRAYAYTALLQQPALVQHNLVPMALHLSVL